MRIALQTMTDEDHEALVQRLEAALQHHRERMEPYASATLPGLHASGGEASLIAAAGEYEYLTVAVDWTAYLLEQGTTPAAMTDALAHLMRQLHDGHANRAMSHSTSVAHNLTRSIKRHALTDLLDVVGTVRA